MTTIRPSSNIAACIPALRAVSLTLTGDRQRADDLVERAIRQAQSDPQPMPTGPKVRVWMFSILHDLHYSGSGLDQRRAAIQPIDDRRADTPPTASSQEGYLLSEDDFRKAFWQLDAHEREVLILVEASGLSRHEVAKVCCCTTRTIDVCVSRARQKLLLTLSPPSEEIRDRVSSSHMNRNSESCQTSAQAGGFLAGA
jgi:RNA polymerase sigma-70 factor (ECF subfamily)